MGSVQRLWIKTSMRESLGRIRRRLTCAPMIGIKFVFLEYELVVDALYVGQIEIRLSDEQGRFRSVYLKEIYGATKSRGVARWH